MSTMCLLPKPCYSTYPPPPPPCLPCVVRQAPSSRPGLLPNLAPHCWCSTATALGKVVLPSSNKWALQNILCKRGFTIVEHAATHDLKKHGPEGAWGGKRNTVCVATSKGETQRPGLQLRFCLHSVTCGTSSLPGFSFPITAIGSWILWFLKAM